MQLGRVNNLPIGWPRVFLLLSSRDDASAHIDPGHEKLARLAGAKMGLTVHISASEVLMSMNLKSRIKYLPLTQVLRNYISKHGRSKIKNRWQEIWERNRDQIEWDENERCFKLARQ